jgi:hypothetical protein
MLFDRIIAAIARLFQRQEQDAERRAIGRLKRLPVFNANTYRSRHKNIGTFDPYRHFVRYGGSEGRAITDESSLAGILGELPRPSETKAPATFRTPVSLPRLKIYVSSLGNVFMREIAEDLAADLRTRQKQVVVLDENSAPSAASISIFVAPHEFFVLGQGPR